MLNLMNELLTEYFTHVNPVTSIHNANEIKAPGKRILHHKVKPVKSITPSTKRRKKFYFVRS